MPLTGEAFLKAGGTRVISEFRASLVFEQEPIACPKNPKYFERQHDTTSGKFIA